MKKIVFPLGNFSKFSLIFIIITGIILIISPIILFRIFRENMDLDFTKSVLLILVPIIAGGIATKISTNSWQLNKEKTTIKRNLLADYEQSYKSRSLLIENFCYQITESYIVYEKDSNTIPFPSYSNTDYQITAFLKLGDPKKEKPIVKYVKEYENFQNKKYDSTFFANKFMSSYRLYYEQNKTLEDEICRLEKDLNIAEDAVLRLMHSKSSEDLLRFYDIFKIINDRIILQLKSVELLMVDLEFRKYI